MQVYRDLRIITARPSEVEEQRVPHRLYGHVDAAENYSTGRWLKDVASTLDEIRAQERLPILVGGTGLYFKALATGLAAIPPIPAQIRRDIRTRIENEGAPALHAELANVDPGTAQRLMPNDRSRIGRALEVFHATGRPLSDWHREGMPPPLDMTRAVKLFLKTERVVLVNRIQTRFGAMLKAGALDEVRALASRNLDPTLPAMKAHGVPWLIRHIRGEISLEQAAEGAAMDTRRYAKRQLTWFRNQLPDWPWMEPAEAAAVVEKTLAAAK
jgi:tRNA dimethylallyltransferase